MKSEKLLFTTRAYQYMQRDICRDEGIRPGLVEQKVFPDGELYQRIDEHVKGRDVFLLGGTGSDSETLELYDLACGLVYSGAISLTVIIPYFGYSTMERAVLPGEIIPAKNRALLFSAIPKARMGNEFVFIDLHTHGVPHYFEGGVMLEELSARSLLHPVLHQAGNDVILASTDAGRAKWVESLANETGVEAAFVYKQRISGEETRITGVNAKVRDRPVLIYDDMIRTGSSLIHAAEAYLRNGAKQVFAFATHGVFPGDAFENLRSSGFFHWIGCTDSHPKAHALAGEHSGGDSFLRIFSLSPLIRDFILHKD
jgi:ribose-phosphate pyrophosphokinase